MISWILKIVTPGEPGIPEVTITVKNAKLKAAIQINHLIQCAFLKKLKFESNSKSQNFCNINFMLTENSYQYTENIFNLFDIYQQLKSL